MRHAGVGVRAIVREREELPSRQETHGEQALTVEIGQGIFL